MANLRNTTNKHCMDDCDYCFFKVIATTTTQATIQIAVIMWPLQQRHQVACWAILHQAWMGNSVSDCLDFAFLAILLPIRTSFWWKFVHLDILKCDRCDNFETISHALLLVHVAQCRGDLNSAKSGSSRQQYPMDVTNVSTDSGNTEDATQSIMDSTLVAASSSNINMNSDSSRWKALKSSFSLGFHIFYQINFRLDFIQLFQLYSSMQLKHNADGNNGNVVQRKLFECDVCNMKFSNGANMRRHKMRHTGVKPYECRVCQKRFFRKDHLAEHFTTHTKTLPYHCPICNRGFQRQIAMRAHFQNEHVGQNDLVKTCPLCNYRAGTMKSLRIHFFNRHGIDLDNPGPNAPSSLLLALDASNAGSYLPSIALAAAAAAAAANSVNNSALSLAVNNNSNSVTAYSDSGDSLQVRLINPATEMYNFLINNFH